MIMTSMELPLYFKLQHPEGHKDISKIKIEIKSKINK